MDYGSRKSVETHRKALVIACSDNTAMSELVEQEQIIGLAIGAIVFTTMVVIGLDVTPGEFKRLLQKPKPIVAGLLAPVLLVPTVVGILSFLSLSPQLEAGLLLIVICPAGNFSNLYCAISQANTVLSITLCVTSTLLAFVTMPLWIAILERALDQPLQFQLPVTTLILRLFLGIALPVGIGMWVRSRFPGFERKFHSILKKFTAVFILWLGGFIIFKERSEFAGNFPASAAVAVGLTLTSMALGALVARLAKLSYRDSITLVLATPVRNVAIAIAIAVSIFHQMEFAVFATTLFMTQIPVLIAASLCFRRIDRKRNREAPLGST